MSFITLQGSINLNGSSKSSGQQVTFSARNGSNLKSISNNAFVTLNNTTFWIEDWDSCDCFDTGTFQPNIPGIYNVSGGLVLNTVPDGTKMIVVLYKNDVFYTILGRGIAGGADLMGISGSILVDMNGTTDRLYLGVFQNSGTSINLTGNNYNYFTAIREGDLVE